MSQQLWKPSTASTFYPQPAFQHCSLEGASSELWVKWDYRSNHVAVRPSIFSSFWNLPCGLCRTRVPLHLHCCRLLLEDHFFLFHCSRGLQYTAVPNPIQLFWHLGYSSPSSPHTTIWHFASSSARFQVNKTSSFSHIHLTIILTLVSILSQFEANIHFDYTCKLSMPQIKSHGSSCIYSATIVITRVGFALVTAMSVSSYTLRTCCTSSWPVGFKVGYLACMLLLCMERQSLTLDYLLSTHCTSGNYQMQLILTFTFHLSVSLL